MSESVYNFLATVYGLDLIVFIWETVSLVNNHDKPAFYLASTHNAMLSYSGSSFWSIVYPSWFMQISPSYPIFRTFVMCSVQLFPRLHHCPLTSLIVMSDTVTLQVYLCLIVLYLIRHLSILALCLLKCLRMIHFIGTKFSIWDLSWLSQNQLSLRLTIWLNWSF
jgi:hypothetical protein